MKKFNITVNGKSYEVEVEEIGGVMSSAPVARPVATPVAAPVAAPAPAAAPSAPAAKPAAALRQHRLLEERQLLLQCQVQF